MTMNETKTYMLVFDFSDGDIAPEQINQYISDARDIEAWWNHMPLVYVIRSRSTPKALTDKLVRAGNGAKFLLAEIDSTNMNGLLPKVAWDWFTVRDPAYSERMQALLQRESPARAIAAIAAEDR
jgi:hypothetical protein